MARIVAGGNFAPSSYIPSVPSCLRVGSAVMTSAVDPLANNDERNGAAGRSTASYRLCAAL